MKSRILRLRASLHSLSSQPHAQLPDERHRLGLSIGPSQYLLDATLYKASDISFADFYAELATEFIFNNGFRFY